MQSSRIAPTFFRCLLSEIIFPGRFNIKVLPAVEAASSHFLLSFVTQSLFILTKEGEVVRDNLNIPASGKQYSGIST